MSFKVLITDYVWPTTEPEETVLREEADAEAIIAPDASEETLISLAKDVDAIMTCFAQVTPNVLKAANKCVVVGRFGVGVDNIAVDTATEPPSQLYLIAFEIKLSSTCFRRVKSAL